MTVPKLTREQAAIIGVFTGFRADLSLVSTRKQKSFLVGQCLHTRWETQKFGKS